MNDWMSDKVSAMPPLSMDRIEGLAELILEEISPDSLAAPTPFDALHLLERVLPDLGVHILPGEEGELRGCEAFTDPAGTGDIEILVCEDMWDDLLDGGRPANRPRATIAHEISHAVLHVPILRRRIRESSGIESLIFARKRRGEIKPYRDPEWQAWALAGCLLAPRKTLMMLNGCSVEQVAERYKISVGMLKNHLKRLKITL